MNSTPSHGLSLSGAQARAISVQRSEQRLKALSMDQESPQTRQVMSSRSYGTQYLPAHDASLSTAQQSDASSMSPVSNSSPTQASPSAGIQPLATGRRRSKKAKSDRGMQRMLEVAAANEAAVQRLVSMLDDFDRRLRVLEQREPQTESEVYESILSGRYRLPSCA
ncbi:hypothetical protein DOTSEDRAFT_28221 [Dothistroma septosporum NZE10]|uniref:Uncharacterized protein n=1 Tax=Dothistroma septosporum (strain NZE10 / CBS 128990) TaxID=675120 RepID=N1PDA3_DOTSN|nr:hypothetical protein DOTSEDRAFT_28221 [Dothistroma septosporum NZE10]